MREAWRLDARALERIADGEGVCIGRYWANEVEPVRHREKLLTMVCRKAGFEGGAWRTGQVQLFTFEAQVITAHTL